MPTNANPVLFPTDFHPHSHAAFEVAVRLAAANDVRLVVLYVCNMPDMPQLQRNGKTFHEGLKEQLANLESPRVEIQRVFTVADPGPEICRVADELDCRMIVMGITIKTGYDQLVFGGVHGFVEKNANCPLVTLVAT